MAQYETNIGISEYRLHDEEIDGAAAVEAINTAARRDGEQTAVLVEKMFFEPRQLAIESETT